MELTVSPTVSVMSQASVESRVQSVALSPDAFGRDHLLELRDRIAESRARVLIISAPGLHLGFNLAEIRDTAAADLTAAKLFAECLLSIRRTDAVTIACVGEKVAGGSVGLVAACDIVIADAKAIFQLPEVAIGMVPALVTPILARRIGEARCFSLALSSRPISATEAHSIGLVDEVAGLAGGLPLDRCVERQARRILRSCAGALTECKQQVREREQQSLQIELDVAIAWLASWLSTQEGREAIARFVDETGASAPMEGRHGAHRD
jgi:enoyl-CoA hydratase/carnithine racemase